MSRPPVADQVQVNFRLPSDLRDRIKAAAEAQNRSMNAELVERLETSFAHTSLRSLLPERLGDRISIEAELKGLTLESEVINVLFEKYPDPPKGYEENLMDVMRDILSRMASEINDPEAKHDFDHALALFNQAKPAVAGTLARHFLQSIVDQRDGTELSAFTNRKKGQKGRVEKGDALPKTDSCPPHDPGDKS